MHRANQRRKSVLVLALALAAVSCEAPDEAGMPESDQATIPGNPLEGAWLPVQVTVTQGDSTVTQDSQPTLYIFSPTHYSMMGTLGGPRTLYNALDPTDEEKLAAFNTFWGNTGTYEVSGDSLTMHIMYARNPNYMAGGYRLFEYRVVGDTLWLNTQSTDGYFRIGEEVVPDPRPFSRSSTRLVRIR